MRHSWVWFALVCLFVGCARKPSDRAKWIRFDDVTKTYSVAADSVPRGRLLDELERVASVRVQPQPERDAPVTAKASGQSLAELIALLLPPGARYKVALGAADREMAVKTPQKRGAVAARDPKLPAKRAAATDLVSKGRLKERPEESGAGKPVTGHNAKRPAEELVKAGLTHAPRVPRLGAAPQNTVRLTLAFEAGQPPRVVAAQAIEGNTGSMRLVNGSYLYAVIGTDGTPLQFGTFQDPLVQHSYQKDGPHDTTRAASGIAAISVSRDVLQKGRLVVIDASTLDLPRELDGERLRAMLQRVKPLAEIEGRVALRMIEQGGQR